MDNIKLMSSSNNMGLMKKGQDEIRKTSLNLDRELYLEFSIEAKRRGIEISELLNIAMRNLLKESKKRK